jgi:hypothetical protein
LENPQNSKKFLRNIQVQSFSKISAECSSSCFELYKKYHSGFLNLQKKEKKFLEKNANTDFEIFSNFENMYFSDSVSPFISFSQQIEQVNFQKQYSAHFKSHQIFAEKKENFINISQFQKYLSKQNIFLSNFKEKDSQSEIFEFTSEKNEKKTFFFHFTKKENKYNFSFYPVQFAPLVLSFPAAGVESFKKMRTASINGTIQMTEKGGFSAQTGSEVQNNQIFSIEKAKSPLGIGINSFFPTFSMNAFQNTLEFQICEKRGAFFDERFSFGNFSDFVESSSFWLNKDSMNFLFSSSTKRIKSKNAFYLSPQSGLGNYKKTLFSQAKDMNFIQNFVFQKNKNFYGSTEFMSPYEGELVPMHTHDTYWWKKASEISTLQKFEKLFTIITKKDLFSVQFPTGGTENHIFLRQQEINLMSKAEKSFNNEEIFENSRDKKRNSFSLFGQNKKLDKKFSLKERQKHLKKLYEVVSEIYQQNNSFQNFTVAESPVFTQSDSKKKTISSFITKYEKKIYTFQNLTVGYPSLLKKPFLGSFVVYGDNFFGSAITKPGQIIHLSFSSMTLRRGQPCLVSSNGILHFSNTPYIQKNVPLVTLPYQTVQAGDIVQGIPKVEQLFEARTTLQGRLFVSSLPILLKGIFERYKVLLPLEQAVRQSFLKIQQIIVDGVQRVYRSQGVSITDKHLEVVVRQMTTKVQILHGAQTGFFPGELVNLDLVERINKFLMVKIRYEPVILGITRASLEVDSFLSASSFQQTTKILSLAAISRKKDFLKGLKENLLVGNLIPSGTGYFNLSKKS